MKRNIIFSLLIILYTNGLFSQEPFKVPKVSFRENVYKSLLVYEDKDKTKNIENILSSTEFTVNKEEKPNFGFSDSTFWIVMNINYQDEAIDELILEIQNPLLDEIEMYLYKNNTLLKKLKTGDHFPFKSRDILHKNPNFKLPKLTTGEYQFVILIKSSSTIQFPIFLYSSDFFMNDKIMEEYFFGIYYGIMVVMILYNFFLLITIKDMSYLYYVLYIIGFCLVQMGLNGYSFKYLWNDSSSWANTSIPFLMGFTILFAAIFGKKFLETKESIPKLDKALTFIVIFSAIICLVSFFIKYSIVIRLAIVLSIIFPIIMLTAGVISLYKGNKSARYFLTAWSILLLGTFTLAFKNAGFLQNNLFTDNIQQIGSALEVILLSLALGDRFNILKKEKELAQIKTIETQKQLVTSYARFVPEQLLHFLGKDIITDIKLGDSIEKEMTILFSDIRSFTTMSEGMTPDENFGFINSYMAIMGPCIRKYNGFIDKYIGDAIMALFPEKPSDAIDASIEMLEELHKLNLRRKEKGFKPISIGIGIHTGNQMLGIIGEKERLEGTVISDVVNTASRLEGLTKAYSSSILVSKDVMDKIEKPEKYIYRHLDSVKVKGKSKGVDILEILNGNSKRIIELKIKLKPLFEQGIEYYNTKNFDKAKENFKNVLKEDPKDKASELYIERCNFYIKNGIDSDWDGIEKLNFK